jgi:histidinol-phosphate aminotransferase
VNEWIRITIHERDQLQKQLFRFSFVEKIYSSDANFLLVKFNDADMLYKYLSENKVVVRNRSKEPGCENCLRITVGTPEENKQLIILLKKYNGNNISKS